MLLFLHLSVFAQKQITVLKDLRSEWARFQGGAYVPLGEGSFTGVNAIYFPLQAANDREMFLRLQSTDPYYLFVNGKVRGMFEGEVALNIDSLLTGEPGGGARVALYQDNINARDLHAEIISFSRTSSAVVNDLVERPYSHFRDFVVIAALILMALLVVAVRLNPKLASDYFSVPRLLSSRESDDGQANARLASAANVQFFVICSLLVAFYLLIVMYNLPEQFALPIPFMATGFGMILIQWLKVSAVVMMVLVLKVLLVFSLTRLFGLRGVARYHFFNWVRLLLVFFTLAAFILFMYFIARGSHAGWYIVFLYAIIIALAGWVVVVFFKLSGRSGHSMFHLFSYLCATEIIPVLITAKVLFQ